MCSNYIPWIGEYFEISIFEATSVSFTDKTNKRHTDISRDIQIIERHTNIFSQEEIEMSSK